MPLTTLSPQQQFHAILSEMGEMFDRKNKDYGQDSDPFANVRRSEQWGIAPWIGAMVRAGDKMTRLETFAQKGTLANEGVGDSLLDLAVYSIIALLLFREEQKIAAGFHERNQAANAIPEDEYWVTLLRGIHARKGGEAEPE